MTDIINVESLQNMETGFDADYLGQGPLEYKSPDTWIFLIFKNRNKSGYTVFGYNHTQTIGKMDCKMAARIWHFDDYDTSKIHI